MQRKEFVGWVLFFLVSLVVSGVVNSLSQDDVNYIAEKLDIRYKVVDNLANNGKTFKAEITLTNKGDRPIKSGDWAVYFCSIRLVVTQSSARVKFEHINGCLHKFQPTKEFVDLSAGSVRTVQVEAQHWVVARTDVMPNWYVASPGLKAKTIASTAGESLSFVAAFTTKQQWKRFPGDKYDPYTAQKRYDEIGIDTADAMLLLIPQPVSMTGLDTDKKVEINRDWKIHADIGLEREAKLLADQFQAAVVTTPPSESSKLIRVALGDPEVVVNGNKAVDQEAYRLQVLTQTVQIVGRTAAGVFYAVQSLLAIADKQNMVPMVTIKDAPRYSYRGMHLDVGRNFMRKSAVLRLLDVMAMYKLNKFHFHLTDDEGWRLEIPGLPELTTVGSKRCHDPSGLKCIQPELGSRLEAATTSFYSINDYEDILMYANDRHIQVIPEFDMPGHGYAAIKAMEARFRNLNMTGNVADAEMYLLTEAGDPSKYLSIQYFTDDAINPCLESTYIFVEKIVKEIVGMHKDIQPLSIYHFGGDEVAHGAWKKSNHCRNLSQQKGFDFSASDIGDKLKDYFVQRVANITVRYNLSLAGWEDGLLGKGDVPYDRSFITNKDVLAYAWNNIWEWGGGKRAYELANAGYQVVMTQATHLYFDHPYEPDPEERGYYWATRFTNTRKTFGFMPDDLFANVELKRNGDPYSREELCAKPNQCVDLLQKQNIIGMAGALWTETVRTADQMDSMVYPRLLALAERAWHKASWEDIKDKTERNKKRTEDWKMFANFLGHHEMARLDKLGVKYYIPPPGASFDNSKIRVRTSLPGLPVQYSEDGGKIWRDVSGEIPFSGKIKLATLSADRSRMSRQVQAHSPTITPSSYLMLVTVLTLAYKIA